MLSRTGWVAPPIASALAHRMGGAADRLGFRRVHRRRLLGD